MLSQVGVQGVICTLVLCVSSLQQAAHAGWQPVGKVRSVRPVPGGVEVETRAATVRATALTPHVIRIRATRARALPTDRSWAVVPEAARAQAKVRVRSGPDAVELGTGAVRVRIDKDPFRVSFLDRAGQVISADAPGRPMIWNDGAFELWKVMPQDEHYFGLGEKAGPLDHRDRAFTMWNTDAFGWQESTDPLYKSVPFFLALRQGRSYGIFLDNTWRSFFDFGKQSRDAYKLGSDGGDLDYYFIHGPHPKDVIERYTWLTGRMPLPALYTLGYQQSRYSYYPQSRVLALARRLRKRDIPADVIYLDIDYQYQNRPFTIDRSRFPAFEQMVDELHDMGFRVVAITDPHLPRVKGYEPYMEGVAGDHFVRTPAGRVYVGRVWPGPSVFPEFTLARTRAWWGTLYEELVAMGIDGFWNDMNEPAVFKTPTKTMPLDVVHRLEDGRTATHRAIHNVYGMLNARATYEGLRRLRPNQRPFVLTRAAFAGTQRYAATWTGDNSSAWDHFRQSLPSLMNLGVSGYPNVGVDIGGFWGSPDPDLLTRWFQLGAFNPIFRNHTMKGSAAQEPWVHGPQHEAIRRRYIELRYRLLPYIYTGMEQASRTGVPLMRPLFLEYPRFFDYPRDELVRPNSSVFLFGRDILVAPPVWPQLQTYEVPLPPGVWFDYWTGQRHAGGRIIEVTPALETLPLYVRAGAIIPHQPVVQSTMETPQGPLSLRVYPGPRCRGSIYQDDGISFDYKEGAYYRQRFSCAVSADGVVVRLAAPGGCFQPWWQRIEMTIYGAPHAPRRIMAGGQAITGAVYDSARGTVRFTIPATRKALRVRVQYQP